MHSCTTCLQGSLYFLQVFLVLAGNYLPQRLTFKALQSIIEFSCLSKIEWAQQHVLCLAVD